MTKPQAAAFNKLQDDKKYRLLFEDAPLPIFILDGYEFLECNKMAEEMLGYSRENLLGASPADYSTEYQPNGEDSKTYAKRLIDAALAGEKQFFEWTMYRPDNRVRLFEISLTPIYIKGEKTDLTHAIARDITELRDREIEDVKQRSLLQQISESTSEYIFIKDLEGRYQYVNNAGAEFLGLEPDKIIGKDDIALFGKEIGVTLQENDREVIENEKLLTYEEAINLDNENRILETIKGPFRDADGNVGGVFGISRDVTELREAERQAKVVARDLAERVKELTCINRITIILDRKGDPFDVLIQEIVEQIPLAMQYPDDASARIDIGAKEYMSAGFAEGQESLAESIRVRGGPVGSIEVNYSKIRSQPVFLDEERSLLKIIADKIGAVLEREKDDEEIRKLAFYDSLTGLPNRQLLIDRMEHSIHACQRSGKTGALLYLDLDNFKNLNDSHGHDRGDKFLCLVAERLQSAVRETDTVARFGGDEFVIILEELSADKNKAVSEASKVAEKILGSFDKPFNLAEYLHYATASMGLTLFDGSQTETEELLKQADISMYQAKSAGRNTYRFFDPNMQAILNMRVEMDNNMRHGLQNNEFMLYYQPLVDRDNQMIACEALLRWQSPEQGLILPGVFIPIADDTGFIIQLGRWVLETACSQLVAWAEDPMLSSMRISINVSANQFRHPNFVNDVLDTITSTHANPEQLKLELTESFLIADIEDAIDKMTALKKRGVSFSLDDFGTGYSSLSYLKRLPLDELKIDRSFVSNILNDKNDAAIARTIIALGKILGLTVVAEGVENEAQRQFLLEEGCDLYQGYMFSRPVPCRDLEKGITESKKP